LCYNIKTLTYNELTGDKVVDYRLVTEQEHFLHVANLEKLVWDADDLDVMSPHILRVIWHTGGCVVGAYDGDVLVGCAIAFAMKGQPRLWSHIAAVHPDYQRQGIGYNLKQQQRIWALANGYTHMSWTFDPLMAANAHFNFHQLGATSHIYHINFYGEMTDALNIGVPSDRLEALWALEDMDKPVSEIPKDAPFLLTAKYNKPVIVSELSENWHFVEIPVNFFNLRNENLPLAIEWKLIVRNVLCPAFEQGYHVVDFVRSPGRNWYVLKRNPHPQGA
jgi:predicted GNAT superfamily acetyltransferase